MKQFPITPRFCLVILLSLGSCRNHKLYSDDISYLFLDYDSYAQNNVGTKITGTVSAQMQTGEALPLKNNQGFNSSDNIHVRIKDGEFNVYTRLPSFKENRIPVTFSYTDKDGQTITSNDTLVLNFTGNAEYYGSAESGTSGVNGTDGGTALLFRDGQDGNPGTSGVKGFDANDLEMHVWRSNDTTFFHVRDVVTSLVSRFMIVGPIAKLYIDAYGGSGGTGGTGGIGGPGKNGEGTNSNNKPKLPGQGGRGGYGGNGGQGGRGANVTVTVHPSATELDQMLIVYNNGGDGGSGGKGGAGGKAGTPITGQSVPVTSVNGASGMTGSQGINGQTLMLTQEFDITVYSK